MKLTQKEIRRERDARAGCDVRMSACVGSGYCCKTAPCPYGERAPGTGWCIHLTPWAEGTVETPRYRCGRHEFIREQPGAELCPAFGAGCSSPLFNTERSKILVELRRKNASLASVDVT